MANGVLIDANADEIIVNAASVLNLAGAGRTTETVKGNADDITDLQTNTQTHKTIFENATGTALSSDTSQTGAQEITVTDYTLYDKLELTFGVTESNDKYVTTISSNLSSTTNINLTSFYSSTAVNEFYIKLEAVNSTAIDFWYGAVIAWEAAGGFTYTATSTLRLFKITGIKENN